MMVFSANNGFGSQLPCPARLRRIAALATIIGALALMAACTPFPIESPDESLDAAEEVDDTQVALVAQASADLAAQLGVEASAIEVESIEAVEWGDSSLGCPEEGMMYAAVVTPGYQITLTHDGVDYVYHTGADADGPMIPCTDNANASAPATGTKSPADSTQGQLVDLAKQDLATQLGVDADAIEVESIEAVEWGDSSLGCPEEGMMYAAVITPGYQIMLTHDGVDYVYHTGAYANSPVVNCTKDEVASESADDTRKVAPMLTTRETLVARAVADLVQRLGVEANAVEVQAVQGVEWRDGSLGCAKAGMMYPQVITPGYRITLSVGGVDYAYHTGGRKDGPVKYCQGAGKSSDDGAYRTE